MNWKQIKGKGNLEYKSGVNKVEPIDLFKEGGILWNWCIGEIIAKAYRLKGKENWMFISAAPLTKVVEDLDEIIHHAEMLKAVINEATRKK